MSYLTEYNGELYFQADDGVHGSELWKFDGNTTSLVQDINPAGSSTPSYMAVYNGELYFNAYDGTNVNGLWKYDGRTVSRVTSVYTGNSITNPTFLTVFKDELFFGAEGDMELWKYDGKDFILLEDLNQHTVSFPGVFTEFNGDLYFNAIDFDYFNPEIGLRINLYKYDETAVSLMTENISRSILSDMEVYNGALYFQSSSDDLWKYDGTIISMVANIGGDTGPFNIERMEVFNDELYFDAHKKLWKYDGVDLTMLFSDQGFSLTNPYLLTAVNDTLYLSANYYYGQELWKYDGTDFFVADINESGASCPSYLTEYNGTLYFQANNGVHGAELWIVTSQGPGRSGLSRLTNLSLNGNPLDNTAHEIIIPELESRDAALVSDPEFSMTYDANPSAPIWNQVIEPQFIQPGGTLDLTLSASDADGDPVFYTAESSDQDNVESTINGNTLTLDGVGGFAGTVTITVTAHDGPSGSGDWRGRTATQTFDLNVGTGAIYGAKWHDLNGDGVWDEDEPGLEGWTIFLDEDGHGILDEKEIRTVTDANGNYSLTNLVPGPYTVCEVWDKGGPWAQISTGILSVIVSDKGVLHYGTVTPLNTNAESDAGYDLYPQVATDGSGNWVAVWRSQEDLGGIGTDYDIFVSRSTNNGATWTAPDVLNTNAATDSGIDNTPQVTTDGAGSWVAVWYSTENLGGAIGTDYDIFISRSTNNGATWTAPEVMNTNAASDSGQDYAPRVTTDGAGNWVAVWCSGENLGGTIGTDSDIFVSRSTDNGATWTAPAPLNTNATSDSGDDINPRVNTDGNGNWVAVWHSKENLGGAIGTDSDFFVSRSTDNGATWTASVALNTNAASDVGTDYAPQVTTDSAGNWVAVWYSQEDLGGIGTDYDIFVSRSTNNGATWTAPVALNTNAASDVGTDAAPQVTTDSSGNWVAVWASAENLGGAISTDYDIFISRSTNNGAT